MAELPINLGGTISNFPKFVPPDINPVPGTQTVDEMIANLRNSVKETTGLPFIPAKSIYTGNRYESSFPYQDTEQMAAQQQSAWDKWGNGLAKFTGTVATTFLNGTVGTVVGLGKMLEDQRFASFYDNSFNRELDEFNKKMEDYLPNYYTHQEQDALWYSPDNLFTANFITDKVIKNLGFAVGAIGSGFAWGGVLKAMGATNRLVQAGKGMETIEAVEEAIKQAPTAASRFGAVSNTLNNLSTQYLKPLGASILQNSERGIISTMGAASEASIEALQNLNQFRDNLISQYKMENGKAPSGKDLEEINQYADKVGNFTWGMNLGLLSLTNYLQLPKILNSSKTAEKRAINELTKETAEGTIGKVGAKWKTPEKGVFSKAGNVAGLFLNPMEAFEEGAQFSIQVGVADYFDRAYRDHEEVADTFSHLTDALGNVLDKGVKETLSSKEGLESMLIGNLSGAIMTSFSPFGDSKIKERGLFGTGGYRATNTEKAISALNKTNLTNTLKDGVKYAIIGQNSQKLRQEAINNDDTLNEKNYEKDYTLSYIIPRVKYGKLDSIKEEVGLYRTQAMSEQGFNELKAAGIILENETREKFLQRLNSIEQTAEQVSKTYELVNDKYSALIDKDGKRAYSDDVIDKMVYSFAKIADFDTRIPELQSKLAATGIDSTDAIIRTAKGENVLKEYTDKINELTKNNLPIPSDQKQETVKDLTDLVNMVKQREQFVNDYEGLIKTPAKFKDSDTKPTFKKDEGGKDIKTIKLKTKDGEEDIEIGTTYFLGKVTELDEKGNEVYRFPKLTVLGENEDGTIKIKDSNGKVRDVSKSVLEDYKLGKVSDTVSNKKAKFFMENANKIFEFNFGKGKKQKGRLEYSPKEGILNFVYKDKKGKIKKIEVTGDQFAPKKGYSNALITPIGTLTAAEQNSLTSFSTEKDDRTLQKRTARLNILTSLFDELLEKQTKTEKLISQKKKEVENISEELKALEESIKAAEFDARSKKSLKFRSSAKKALDAAIRLSRTKEQLENEIEQLETQKEELEFNATYVADLAQNIDELPTDTRDFLEELKEQTLLLESTLLETGRQINYISSLIDKVQSTLDSAIKYLKSVLDNFKNMYPKVPLALGEEWVEFLNNNPNFLKSRPYYKSDLKFVEDLVAQVEDLDIIPNERTLNELQSELVELQKSLVETEKELKAKNVILDKFKQLADQYKEQQQEQERLKNNESIKKQLLSKNTNEQEIVLDSTPFEPQKKKDDYSVIFGTIPVDDGKPHQKRANQFGINYSSFPEEKKNSLRIQEITQNTEEVSGIPGLIESLIREENLIREANNREKIDPKTVVVAVIKNSKNEFVDENGEVITGDLLSKAIYQVRPTERLEMNYSEDRSKFDMQTMFRSSTKDEVKQQLKEQYTKDRKKVLQSTEPLPLNEFSVSFGRPLYEKEEEENSVTETELVTNADIQEKSLLEVATTNEPTPENGVSFTKAIGRVFLRIPGIGMLKLNTNKIDKVKAETIFDVIKQISKNISEDPVNGVKNSEVYFNWLRSVIYWGVPKNLQTNERKDPSYNNVWFEEFEDGITRLVIGKNGDNFIFTPQTLEANKALIISLLQERYHNVSNSVLTNKGRYNEITGVKKDGTPEIKEWENGYQEYLLSSKGRKKSELPLTTPVKKGKNNREGIYFIIQNQTIDQKENPKPLEQPKTEEKPTSIFELGEKEEKPKLSIFDLGKKEEPKPTEQPKQEDTEKPNIFTLGTKPKSGGRRANRLISTSQIFSPENWNDLEKWLSKNLPNIPVYRVKNVITSTNGRQAWGYFENGAIYLYKNADIGTGYHEAFEAIWEMFTDNKERESIYKEFRNRKGSFQDRFNPEKTIKYSEATEEDIREELAEEFRDYILYKKIPTKPTVGKPYIIKLFYDLVNFIKEFFTGESAQVNTANLFSKIGNGYYSTVVPQEGKLAGIIDIDNAEPDFSAKFRLAYSTEHQLMQEMTYSTLSGLIADNKDLFEITSIKKNELYNKLKDNILSPEDGIIKIAVDDIIEKYNNDLLTQDVAQKQIDSFNQIYFDISNNWKTLVEKHEVYLKKFDITFDENDEGHITNENTAHAEATYTDSRKVDSFRKTNPAIKMLFATLPKLEYRDGQYYIKSTPIGGVDPLPMEKAFITVKNAVYNAVDIDDMMEKLRKFALENPDYRTLYSRLMKQSPENEEINYNHLQNPYDLRLISAFWKAMKSQNADVKIVFILGSGEIEVSDAHLADATRQAKNDLYQSILSSLRKGNKYVEKRKDNKYYATKGIKELKLNPKEVNTYTAFLSAIGVDFSKQEINKLLEKKNSKKYAIFQDAVNGIKLSISSISEVKDFTKKSVDIEGKLTKLGAIKAWLTNPEFESTYFNVNGEKTQTYIGTNLLSDFYDQISKITNINQLKGTKFEYILTDTFSQNSNVIKSLFNLETGNKREGFDDIFKQGIAEGIVDQGKGKSKESSQLTSKERLILDMNLNSEGWYLNLVPGDASIESMIKLHDEGSPFVKFEDMQSGYSRIYSLFKNHFIAEVNTSRDDREIAKVKGRKNTDLRFFKGILGEELHDKIIKDNRLSPEKLYTTYQAQIESKIKKFVDDEAENNFRHLLDYGIVEYSDEGLSVKGLAFTKEDISKENLMLHLTAMAANFQIANIEIQKIYYSDPYFYKDELKRIKNFGSPAQPLINSRLYNRQLNSIYNKGLKPNDIGYIDFERPNLRTAVIEDTNSIVTELIEQGYTPYEETDGGGLVTLQANRKIRVISDNWTNDNEKQYQFDIEFEKLFNSGATKEELQKFLKDNPNIKNTYTPIKPIARGNRNDGHNYNDIVLDKFALVPYSFRLLWELNPESNAIKHYQRMRKFDVDYTVFSTGRKVGLTKESKTYEKDGSYTKDGFAQITNVPIDIFAIQSDVPSKEADALTTGSQITKMATMDFMDAGVPIDFEPNKKFEDRLKEWNSLKDKYSYKSSTKGENLYSLIKHNEELLNGLIKQGFDTLLTKLSLIRTKDGYKIENVDKLIETLTDEIYKREVNDNIIDAFKGFKNGQVILEATPVYQQIRNIIYSIANKQVVRRKIHGGMKVQVPSTLLESVRAKATEYKGKTVYESDDLKFYSNEDGERICEIMISKWFKSDKTDEELIKELNESGVLNGIGFRIPTQKQNSIDVFRIKRFLPDGFGDSVVIPSALVKKAGSDFDIDKLNLYFKNVYKDFKGNIKLIPFFGYGQKAISKFEEMFDSGEFLSEEDKNTVKKWIKNRQAEERDEVVEKLFNSIFGEKSFEDSYLSEVMEDFLDSKDFTELKKKIVNEKYKQSLENEYIKSLEDLTSHPLNFDKLITPNSAQLLKDLADKVTDKVFPGKKLDYTNPLNLLNRNFMERLRWAFVRGKYAIGIAATAQTNNAQNQRSIITIDYEKLDNQSETDKLWLGDGIIKFKDFNKIDGKPTLSLSKDSKGHLISDIIGQFIDGYVDISKGPWIMELGATPNTAGTWLFLIKLGVPIEQVAAFMNQPIIRDYLKNIENAGYSYIFNSTEVENIMEEYSSNVELSLSANIPSTTKLWEMVGKTKLSAEEKAEQLLILEQFLKSAKYAEQLFHVQQGSNFDTANLNDPFLVFKKMKQLEKARKTMISSVDSLLENSFVGTLKDILIDVRNAYSELLLSDKQGQVRDTLEKVLEPYVDINDRDFVKISQKAVADLFDFAVQNDTKLNDKIKSVLLGTETEDSATEEIMDFFKTIKPEHPLYGNYIVNSLRPYRSSVLENKPQNLSFIAKLNKLYDQNSVIYGFRELKDYLKSIGKPELYDKLIYLSVLQSGLSNSKISFTHLLPYEDFVKIYNKTLSQLENLTILPKFAELNVFDRNNWNNDDIVKNSKATTFKNKKGNWVHNVAMIGVNMDKKLPVAIENKEIPQLAMFRPGSPEGREEIIAYTWEKTDELLTLDQRKAYKFEYKAKMAKIFAIKNEMRKKGDFSYIQKGLFQKVYNPLTGQPLIYTSEKDGVTYTNYVYRAINAWGDSFKANEFYTIPRQSVINNGFITIPFEQDTPDIDAKIASLILPDFKDNSQSKEPKC